MLQPGPCPPELTVGQNSTARRKSSSQPLLVGPFLPCGSVLQGGKQSLGGGPGLEREGKLTCSFLACGPCALGGLCAWAHPFLSPPPLSIMRCRTASRLNEMIQVKRASWIPGWGAHPTQDDGVCAGGKGWEARTLFLVGASDSFVPARTPLSLTHFFPSWGGC